ncbi:MarR family winged helix-turn-helix transcriptional regulator [Salipiger sp. P9]|uniref:MarR family winged helix-turn-helix transcriptional regulator n=1 Tax=Salipiger pentaromativorans TaxID=2943193 RepID=UPI0021584A47|nr:MarR family winged helix-turn-helix transcriptional regulator [Salipiger pentaromativorans]MCR8548128.1 MarR family winged helix-turn-helix transcriptional regulator [Salipiger pentaromativorans]
MTDALDPELPLSTTLEVRDRCLCLQVQRAARQLARRFDTALKPLGLTNGQFSILMSLNRPEPPRISDLAPFLAMDRTTLTAAFKVLERRGLVESLADRHDRRNRRLRLSLAGRDLLKRAVPVWRAEHDALDAALAGIDLQALRAALAAIG